MMFRRFAFAALALGVLGGQAALSQAQAQPCRDAKGKFVKCDKKMTKAMPCRDDKGKFTKCDKKNANKKMNMKSDMPMKAGMPDAKMPADAGAR